MLYLTYVTKIMWAKSRNKILIKVVNLDIYKTFFYFRTEGAKQWFYLTSQKKVQRTKCKIHESYSCRYVILKLNSVFTLRTQIFSNVWCDSPTRIFCIRNMKAMNRRRIRVMIVYNYDLCLFPLCHWFHIQYLMKRE